MAKYQKGKSGNPGGRPKQDPDVRALAVEHSSRAIRRLVELMGSEDERVALAACNAILDRAIGKPAQALEVAGTNEPFIPVLNISLKEAPPSSLPISRPSQIAISR